MSGGGSDMYVLVLMGSEGFSDHLIPIAMDFIVSLFLSHLHDHTLIFEALTHLEWVAND